MRVPPAALVGELQSVPRNQGSNVTASGKEISASGGLLACGSRMCWGILTFAGAFLAIAGISVMAWVSQQNCCDDDGLVRLFFRSPYSV
jgi:hypothetical protein